MDASKLDSLVTQIIVTSWRSNDALRIIDKKTSSAILKELRNSDAVKLSNEEHERRWTQGDNFILHIELEDRTTVDMWITPSMNIISIGDNYYQLTDRFQKNYVNLFKSKTALPTHWNPVGSDGLDRRIQAA